MGKRKGSTRKRAERGRRRWAGRLAEQLFRTLTGQVVLAVTALTVIIGGWVSFDGYVAKAADVRLVELRLDRKILKDDRTRVQQRIWQFEDRNRTDCLKAERDARSPHRDQCRTLLEELRGYDEQLKPGEPKKQ